MESIKFDRIVSVSNEIQGHSARNILDGEISPSKNWMCEKGTEKGMLILQLERAAVLTSVHVGNAHSAFVEVLVGRAAGGSDEFESLIPMSIFMNPQESKTGTNPNRTRFFNKEDFNESAASKSWDRIKVVCTQPFNRHVPYGLCFLKVHGDREAKKATDPVPRGSDDAEEIEIGSFFKKRTSRGDKPPLTVSEQIKEAEKESSLVKHTPISIAKMTARMKEKTPAEKKAKKEVAPSEEREKRGEKRKKKEEETPKKRKQGKKTRKKVFERLMEDVVLVISGFQNPLRGNIRSKALAMGAKYSADWADRCTHLVCAYENTPKFNQVKGKGKIVRKEWVEKCHDDRKRYPWRRFALSKADSKGAESEEEIEAGDESGPEQEEEVARTPKPGTSKEAEGGGEERERKAKTSDDDYDLPTDEETEESREDTSDYPMPFLSDAFASKTFYVDPNVKNKSLVERYIVAYNGTLKETLSEDVQFLVTEKGGAPLQLFRKKAPDLVAVRPSWIWEVNSKEKCVPTTPHLVK